MRILFITTRFPYPPLKGDSLRTYHQIKALSRRSSVTLLSMHEGALGDADYGHVADMCERVVVVPHSRGRALLNLVGGLPSRLPLQVSYYRSVAFRGQLDSLLAGGSNFDVAHATLLRTLPYVWGLAGTPLVVDLIDSYTLNLGNRRGKVRGPLRLGYELEYGRVKRYEREVVRRFPSIVVSSPADKQALGAGANIEVIPNGVDVEQFAYGGQEGREPATLIFTGNMGYHPNDEAVLWFAREVWPVLRQARPDLRFQVVGTNPSERVRALAEGHSGIEVLGRVPDVGECLRRATIAVAPMRTGSGIQNKVLEAMSTGTPVVATKTANRGVGGVAGRDLLLAETASEFASTVLRLLADTALRRHIAFAGRDFVEGHFRWEQHAERLMQLYGAAIGGGVEREGEEGAVPSLMGVAGPL